MAEPERETKGRKSRRYDDDDRDEDDRDEDDRDDDDRHGDRAVLRRGDRQYAGRSRQRDHQDWFDDYDVDATRRRKITEIWGGVDPREREMLLAAFAHQLGLSRNEPRESQAIEAPPRQPSLFDRKQGEIATAGLAQEFPSPRSRTYPPLNGSRGRLISYDQAKTSPYVLPPSEGLNPSRSRSSAGGTNERRVESTRMPGSGVGLLPGSGPGLSPSSGVGLLPGSGRGLQVQDLGALDRSGQTGTGYGTGYGTATGPVARQETAAGSGDSSAPTDWRGALAKTIMLLEDKVYNSQASSKDRAEHLETVLHLLYATSGQSDQAVEPIYSLDPDEREFWQHLIHSMTIVMETEAERSTSLRAAATLRELRAARRMLARLSDLDVKQMTFCTAVHSFGQFEAFEGSSFKPEQKILLYFEVDNFVSTKSKKGYETRLKGRYSIYNAEGDRVANRDYPSSQETCRNYRRDYFVRYMMTIPAHLEPGQYMLELTVEDENAKKFGQGVISFDVRSR